MFQVGFAFEGIQEQIKWPLSLFWFLCALSLVGCRMKLGRDRFGAHRLQQLMS